jgi:hypothetical protein
VSYPATGLAIGEPDDRLQRGIQYAAASQLITNVSGILGRPVKAGDDSRENGARSHTDFDFQTAVVPFRASWFETARCASSP